MNQLDRLEKLTETYQPTVSAMAEDLKSKASVIATASIQKIEPIDQYLKNSYMAAPINIAVDGAKNLVDRYIPEKKDSSADSSDSSTSDDSGPIFRSGKLAMRMQKEALAKLQNLSLRDATTTGSYAYVIDLIQYAAKNLDTGMESTTKYVHDSINTGMELSKDRARATTEQVQQRSHDAMVAIFAAIDAISKQIPEPVVATSHEVYDSAKLLSLRLEDSNMALYTNVSAKSAEMLREMSSMFSTAMQNASNGTLPATMLQTAKSTLHGILDNLIKVREGSSSTTPATSSDVASSN